MGDAHSPPPPRSRRALAAGAIALLASCGLSHAAEGVEKCRLSGFLRAIGYEGVMSADDALVSLEDSLGDAPRCVYQVRFSPCIGKALARFDAAAALRPSSQKARQALLMVNVTKALVEHGVQFSYAVRKAGFFSRPEFSDIEASENLFGFPIKGSDDIFDRRTLGGWKYLCRLGTMSDARFLKEIRADKDFGGGAAN